MRMIKALKWDTQSEEKYKFNMRLHSTSRKTSLNFGDPFFNFNAAFLLNSAILWIRDVGVSVAIIYTQFIICAQFHIHNKFKVRVISSLLRLLLCLRSIWCRWSVAGTDNLWGQSTFHDFQHDRQIFPVLLRTNRSAWLAVKGWSLGLGIALLSVSVTLSEDTRFTHMKQVERCYRRAILVLETTLSHSICAELLSTVNLIC